MTSNVSSPDAVGMGAHEQSLEAAKPEPESAGISWARALRIHISALRPLEVTLMVGLFGIGSVFAVDALTTDLLSRFALYLLGSWLFVFSVYSLNMYGGYREDGGNPKFGHVGIVPRRYFFFTSALASAGFTWFYLVLDPRIWLLALGSFVLWVMYCLPTWGAKRFPIWGVLIHLLSQLLHFQMGYLLFRPLDSRAVALSLYFGIVWAAAYLNHEVIDHEHDREAGVNTTAVRFGQAAADKGSATLFALGTAYWLWLYLSQVIELWELLPFAAVFGALVVTKAWFSVVRGGTISHPIAYRAFYRFLFVAGATAYVALKFAA